MPSSSNPAGTLIAGCPVTLKIQVSDECRDVCGARRHKRQRIDGADSIAHGLKTYGRRHMSVEARIIGGRYRLDEVIGSGGMGQVWRGYDELLRRPLAVKEIQFSAGSLAQRDAVTARAVA